MVVGLLGRNAAHDSSAPHSETPPARVVVVSPDVRGAAWWHAALRRRHFTVYAANSAETAGALVAGSRPNVIVIDVTDNSFEGGALCRRLKAANATRPILLLHTHGTIDDLVAGFDSGADAYLRGSFTEAVLLAQIGALTRRQRYAAAVQDHMRVAQ